MRAGKWLVALSCLLVVVGACTPAEEGSEEENVDQPQQAGTQETLVSPQPTTAVTPGGTTTTAEPSGTATTASRVWGIAGNGRVRLYWNMEEEAAYNIYWSTNARVNQSTGTPILKVESPYLHEGLENGKTYYYVVLALSASGASEESAVAQATPDMVKIPVGKFTMGDDPNEFSWSKSNPQHQVTLTKDYLMSAHEVTAREYQVCLEHGSCKDDFADVQEEQTYKVPGKEDDPVNYVSWQDTQNYLQWLNQNSPETNFRLCTEAEWEYAARAGATALWSCQAAKAPATDSSCLKEAAWYKETSSNRLHPVKTKQANLWGIHDLHGNVWEWVADWLGEYSDKDAIDPKGPDTGDFKVYRGGGYRDDDITVRSTNRGSTVAEWRDRSIGFRLCLSGSAK